MTLQQLRYFREIARQDLNISKAAAVLHITQPGLSRQLRLLEQELGVELFVRNRTRLVRLSDAGSEIVAMWKTRPALSDTTMNSPKIVAASQGTSATSGAEVGPLDLARSAGTKRR